MCDIRKYVSVFISACCSIIIQVLNTITWLTVRLHMGSALYWPDRQIGSVHLSLSFSLSGACHEDVAASTSRRHAGLSILRRLAIARPKLSGRRSSSTVLSHVCLGLPVLRRQSLGNWEDPESRPGELGGGLDLCRQARHRWPNKDKRRWRI